MGDQVDDLRRVTQRFFRSFGVLAAESTPCGKPLALAHAHALVVLLRQGELTQQSLGAELGVDKSNVARLCEKMVRAGHVRQRANEQDGRSRIVGLSARGMRLAQEVEMASRERFTALLERIPEERQVEVIAALGLLVEAVGASSMPSRQEEKALA